MNFNPSTFKQNLYAVVDTQTGLIEDVVFSRNEARLSRNEIRYDNAHTRNFQDFKIVRFKPEALVR